jgi:CBS domain-containing protein
MMKAADIMTLGAATIRPDASIAQAAQLMLQYRISGLPVVDAAGVLVGIVTEGDLLRRADSGTEQRRPRWLEFLLGPGRLADEYVHTHSRRVEDVMSRDIVTVSPETPVSDVVGQMERRGIKRIPVVREGKVVGIISRANLLRGLARLADEAPEFIASDNVIRERILGELSRQSWGQAPVDISVGNGVVHLRGAILDDRLRDALRVACKNVPGVKSVRDHLVLVEPVSGMVLDRGVTSD